MFSKFVTTLTRYLCYYFKTLYHFRHDTNYCSIKLMQLLVLNTHNIIFEVSLFHTSYLAYWQFTCIVQSQVCEIYYTQAIKYVPRYIFPVKSLYDYFILVLQTSTQFSNPKT